MIGHLKKLPVLVLLLSVAPCAADEVRLAIDQALMGMSEAFRPSTDELGYPDLIYNFNPEVLVEGKNSNFDYFVSYSPQYRGYARTVGANGWNHQLRARTVIALTPVDEISASFDLFDYRVIQANSIVVGDGSTDFTKSADGKSLQTAATLSYSHNFNMRSQFVSVFSYQGFEYTSPGNTDNRSINLDVTFQHILSPRLFLGANLSGNYRVFMTQSGSAFRFQTTVNPNVIANYQINKAWNAFVRVGPSLIYTENKPPGGFEINRFGPNLTVGPAGPSYYRYSDPGGGFVSCASLSGTFIFPCQFFPGGASVLNGRLDEMTTVGYRAGSSAAAKPDDVLTYFMTASLEREGPNWEASLMYTRSEQASQGAASSTVMDMVGLRARGNLGEKWLWTFNSGWYQRISTAPYYETFLGARNSGLRADDGNFIAEVDSLVSRQIDLAFETATVWTELRLVRELTRNLSLDLRLRYDRWLHVIRDGISQRPSQNVTGELGFRYEFNPFLF